MDKLPAIEGGKPVRQEFLQFCRASIGDEEINEVVDTLKSGWLTTGPKCMRFEEEIKKYVNTKEAIAVNSCTAAGHIVLKALGIKHGDAVITSPVTFASMVNNIIHLNAKPVFVDVQEGLPNINHDLIEEKINKNTKAIMVTHYAGIPCEMDEINKLAKDYGIPVIEDAAHAIGSLYKGNKIGSLGYAGLYSFYATKNLTTAEGGMIVTNDMELAEKSRVLRLHGISKDAWKRYHKGGNWEYDVIDHGFKYNMTDIQAALGLAQLKKLDNMLNKRKELVDYYNKELSTISEIETPKHKDYVKPAWHIYTIKLDTKDLKVDKNKFMQALAAENIGISLHFIPLNLQSAFKNSLNTKEGDFPVAEESYKKLISLPLFPDMTKEDVNDVVSSIKKLIEYYKK